MNQDPNIRKTVIEVGLNTNDTIDGDDDDDDSTNSGEDTGEALDNVDAAMQKWLTDPNDTETQDRLMDEFQDLLQWQQDQVEAAESQKDDSAVTAITACAGYLQQSQAAARKKDLTNAKHYLAEYQACMAKVKLPKQSDATSPRGGQASKGKSGGAKLTHK